MTARELALDVLRDAQRGHDFAWERLDTSLRHTPLPPAERRLATELIYGSLRRRGSLDALLRILTENPRRTIEPHVWELLRLGAYQLIYLDHIPPHAAINESVELAKTGGHARAAGFINGVLRNLDRLLTPDIVRAAAADALPLVRGSYRRLARPVLPDPVREPGEYVSAAFSLPRWLVDRCMARFNWDETVRLGFWFAEPAPLWIRVNPLRTTRNSLREQFAAMGYETEPGEHPQSLRFHEHAPIRSLPGYDEGLFTVQDHSAMTVASALAPEPGMTILDQCAAPGGKTSHLAELMDNSGWIVACDVNERRLQTVIQLCERLGVTIVEPKNLTPQPPSRDGKGEQELESSPPFPSREGGPGGLGSFDAALVDVPCSNTGVLGRRPEVRWRLKPTNLTELVALQTRLLLNACSQVRSGGVVVYSTCSIEPEENGGVVRAALEQLPNWTQESEQEHRPGLPADGGYWVKLRRSG